MMSLIKKIIISENETGQRIDNFLFRICKRVPRCHIYRILHSGEVRVNGCRVNYTCRLKNNDIVRVPPMHFSHDCEPKKIFKQEFQVLFEDNYLLIINKPSGLAVHSGSGIRYGLIEQLRASRPYDKYLELVHRLDRDTSGILLLTKKRSTLISLHAQIRDGLINKRYLVLVQGHWKHSRREVTFPLHQYTTLYGEKRVYVHKNGKASHTIFSLIRRYNGFTLLEAELKTGRMHQIRVHLAAIGFAIVGDNKYGNLALNKILRQPKIVPVVSMFNRMFLHAYKTTFLHPNTNKIISLTVDLPVDCILFLQKLKTLEI